MRTVLLLVFICFFSCTESNQKLSEGLQYFPKRALLNEGLVWKYYNHRSRENKQTLTDIIYIKKILDGNKIVNEQYNAAFQKVNFSQVVIQEGKWKILEDRSFRQHVSLTDPYKEHQSIVKNNVLRDWLGNDAKTDILKVDEGNGYRNVTYQTENIDSSLVTSEIKIFKGIRDFIRINDDEPIDTIKITWEKHYETDLGMTYSTFQYDDYISEMTLDEIITLSEFEKRANHGTHRVAYIDTTQTLDDPSHFKPCFHPANINDYYNDEIAQFTGGKGRLRAVLDKKLDPRKLTDASGYLTYRFVINCNGEAGWFVTEEADLEYKKISFDESCRMHLYDILKAENQWTNAIIHGETRDAYTYITFKIDNGKIIELLP